MRDDVLPPAAQKLLGMIGWRLDLIERALRSQDPGSPGLGEAAAAVMTVEAVAALADELMEECEQRGYSRRVAEEQAEREAAERSRAGLRLIRAAR